MQVLYIITQADEGGAQKYVLALAQHFKGAIAAGQEAQKLFKDAKAHQIQFYPLKYLKRNINPLWDILALWELVRLAKKTQPDVIHLNSSKAGFLGSLIRPFVKAKVIFTAHGFVFNEPRAFPLPWLARILEKFASRFRDYIICVSESDKNSALRFGIIDPKKISTVHNGLGPIKFLDKETARKALKLKGDRLIVGSLSGFYRTKGLDVLIEAIATMSKEARNRCDFILIGDGPEFKNLQLKIKNLQLEQIITTPGKIADANRHLKAFDIFVMPSRKEGFPFALLEAMAGGLPIIASNVGGNPEAVGDAAMLVKANHVQVLADALEILSADPELRQALGQKALERSKMFSEEKMLGETEKIYQKIL